jgi:hypothetical protein
MTSPPATFVPLDGRITSLQVLDISLSGVEVMEIVSPGVANGNNFQVTTAVLGAYFGSFTFGNRTIITAGATLSSPYTIANTDTNILLDKTIASNSYIIAPLAASILGLSPILIKDFNGQAAANPITISFTGGELCDGQSTLQITNPYGWVRINPNTGGGGWFQS